MLVLNTVSLAEAAERKILKWEDAAEIVHLLPEVKVIEKRLKGFPEVKLNIRMEEEPTSEQMGKSKYRLAVAESHPTHLATLDRYEVDAWTKKVFYYDLPCEVSVPIEVWRAQSKRIDQLQKKNEKDESFDICPEVEKLAK